MSGRATPDDFAAAWLADVRVRFAELRRTAERALAQVPDAALFAAIDDEANTLAVLMQHVGGNLRSRFADFLVTDGEKPDRDRDGEFVVRPGTTRAGLEARWRAGWETLEGTLAALAPTDLARPVTLRGEAMPAFVAVHRALAHVAQHVGQIVLLAKHAAGAEWRTLSIPRAR